MRVPVTTGLACAYCFEPYEARMVPIVFTSRGGMSSHICLHIRCAQAAFRDSKARFDWDDLAVDINPTPPSGRGWADIPDDDLPSAT